MNSEKSLIREYWDARPCGSSESIRNQALGEFFQNYARIRYEREPEIQRFARFEVWRGQRVLEIGVGMGTDYVRFAKAGANTIGVDLSVRSLELASRNARINQLTPLLLNADAESLPFANHSFDLVYSWGVLHHTPNTEQALREVHRVLTPGSECHAMLYHRRSLLALQCYLRYGLAGLRPFTPLSRLLGKHIESPGTKAFTVAEVRRLFKDFRNVEITPTVTAYDVRLGRRWFLPRWVLQLVPNQIGWFLLIRAQK